MDRALIHCLTQLGCNDKHVRFYRANLQLGAVPLADILKQARLQRSTGYLIASEMIAMGLVEEDLRTYKKHYSAVEPDVLLRKLEAKHRRLGRDIIAFKEVLPSLRAEHQATKTRPRVRTFEDKNGLVAVWRDILQEQQEVLLWTNQDTEQLIFSSELHEQFIRERVAKEIHIRVLAVDNEASKTLIATDAQVLRRTKLLPKDMQFTSETYIYGNKVAVLDFGKKIFGVITENEQIAASQRAIFNTLWNQT